MKVMRKIIQIDEDLCNGCGQCILSCAECALKLVDGKAKVISDNLCDGLGACIGECPQGALKLIERETEEFDEIAVDKHLSAINVKEKAKEDNSKMACGCPSSSVQMFVPCKPENSDIKEQVSQLTHWPIQIKLVPATASFLNNAHLLILADCSAVAYASLHTDLLKGRVVLMGCPRSSQRQEYEDKFTDIFKIANIKSITVVIMEVPCCIGLPLTVQKALQRANQEISMEKIVISVKGKIISKIN